MRLDIEVGRRFVEEIDVCVFEHRRGDGDALQFSAADDGDVAVHDVREIKELYDASEFGLATFVRAPQEVAGRPAERLRYLLDHLRFVRDLDLPIL